MVRRDGRFEKRAEHHARFRGKSNRARSLHIRFFAYGPGGASDILSARFEERHGALVGAVQMPQ
jgi:hypothetical protein